VTTNFRRPRPVAIVGLQPLADYALIAGRKRRLTPALAQELRRGRGRIV